jgi:transcriptional antiterminator RfaH
MKRWYAVHTHPGGERKATENLQRQGYDVYMPHYVKARRHARRVEKVRAPLFPRYLFVHLDTERTRWRTINSTIGVSHLVCQGEIPSVVPDHLITEIRAREDADGAVRLSRLMLPRTGDRVRFVDGPMMDCTGIFECMRDEDRVVIMLNLVGRPTRVTAPSDAIVICA